MRRITIGDPRLGTRMRELRKARRLTQEALAKRLHIKADKLSRFEQGKQLPTLNELRDFANKIGRLSDLWRDLKRLWDQAQEPEVVRWLALGQNPDAVFAELYPFVYAADTPLTHMYERMSQATAAFAEAYAGLRGKRVLDMGSGYGLTTLALAAYGPREIVAVDQSAPMIELLTQVLLSTDNLDAWLRSMGVPVVLDELYEPTLAHLHWMRTTFQGGLFARLPTQGTLHALVGNGLALTSQAVGPVDVVVANNYLHWPVNQRLNQLQQVSPDLPADELLASAVGDALRPLAALLPPQGIAVITETKDFVTLDDEPALDTDLEEHFPTVHPRFIQFQETVNRLLKEEWGIERDIPQTTKLFPTSTMPTLVRRGGFALRRMHLVEFTYTCDPLHSFVVRLPLLLGRIAIPVQAKIDLAKRVRRELGTTPLTEAIEHPLRIYWFFFVLERLAEG